MTIQIFPIATFLCLGVVTLQAQTTASYQLFGAPAVGSGTLGSQVVTGRPFSATEERHSVQVLGDGTHIENSETNRLYRDDQGRTRVERTGGNISIVDPVAGFTAELNPSSKVVSKGSVIVRDGRILGRASSAVNKAIAEAVDSQLRTQWQESAVTEGQFIPRPLKAQIAKQVPEGTGGADPAKVDTASPAAKFTAERTLSASSGDGLLVFRAGLDDNASPESLPAQMINGALAQGTRTTETIPVGKIGNDRVITVVNEKWFSSALQLLVKSTSSDPRFGDTTYQLVNIVQAAPDPSLFQIPADYTMR